MKPTEEEGGGGRLGFLVYLFSGMTEFRRGEVFMECVK
jgi:hypothetical protein